ncbi:MAG TPA: HEAT repeat domain-containing protein, partial [Gemmataceae bacterium]|nr:HEAT repeat domain-containing protein [Gemmataceae bacterium]
PRVCMVCGARRDVTFVQRRFLWRPVFAPGLFMLLTTRRVTADIPLCPEHGGPRLFATQRFTWWGLKTVAIGDDRLTLGRVADEFADALQRWRDGRKRGEIAQPTPPPLRTVQVGRGTGGGAAALKTLGVVLGVMAGLVVLGVLAMFGLMAMGLVVLSRPAAPAVPPVVGPEAAAETRPETVVVGLLSAAPQLGAPAGLPWGPLGVAGQKATFHYLEDAELDRLLAELKSRDPNKTAAAAQRLARAPPDPVRRKEAAEALAAAAANPFPTARQAAAEALAVWGGADDVPALVRLLDDPFPNVKTAAVAALVAVKDPKAGAAALSALEKASRDINPTVARAAADAVQTISARQKPQEKHP